METQFGKDNATFRTNAEHDGSAQAQIISSYIRAQLVKQIVFYGVATIFILAGCFLIAFAPSGREQVTTIIAAALFALAIGLGGFSYFKLKAPFVSAEVGAVPERPVDPPPAKNDRS